MARGVRMSWRSVDERAREEFRRLYQGENQLRSVAEDATAKPQRHPRRNQTHLPGRFDRQVQRDWRWMWVVLKYRLQQLYLASYGRLKTKDHTVPEHPQVRQGWRNKWLVPKYHLLRQFMQCLASYVVFFLFEGSATIIEIIISLWEFGAGLVTRSETPNHARQLVPQHLGYYGKDIYKSKALDFLESKLLDDSLLGLWGPSGVGKTRFLHLMIACYSSGDALFDHILPIQFGAVRDTHHSLAMLLKLDWVTMSLLEEHQRAKIISNYLKHKNFLVLLDDVKDKNFDLASIGLPMRLRRGQKIILTSRSQTVCIHMGCTLSNIIEMKCLGEEDAWDLFKYKAKVEITESNVKVHRIAKQMLLACGGLPRAICAVGVGVGRATFCRTNPDDWSIAYERFKVKAKNLPPERMEEIWAVRV